MRLYQKCKGKIPGKEMRKKKTKHEGRWRADHAEKNPFKGRIASFKAIER